MLNVLAQNIPWFLGGSADLGPSNKTTLKFADAGDFQAETPGGRNFQFGIREHSMAAIVNRFSLSKLRPFGATFFIFSDYARPAIRLSALMELPTIFVFTHDAMGDRKRPTRQPIEQLASLRQFRALRCSGPAMQTRSSRLTGMSCSCGIGRPCWRCRARRCRRSTGPIRRSTGVAQGAYVLADAPAPLPNSSLSPRAVK